MIHACMHCDTYSTVKCQSCVCTQIRNTINEDDVSKVTHGRRTLDGVFDGAVKSGRVPLVSAHGMQQSPAAIATTTSPTPLVWGM